MKREEKFIHTKGVIGAKIERDKYGDVLTVTSNGWQWSGRQITPKLAKCIIKTLEEYIKE